jgi:excisionase family DNA binding protein
VAARGERSGASSEQLKLFPPTRYLTVEEVAEVLGVPKTFIYRRTCRGHPDALPSYRFGGHLRFLPSDIEDWIEAHRREPATAEPVALVAALRKGRRAGSRASVRNDRARRSR